MIIATLLWVTRILPALGSHWLSALSPHNIDLLPVRGFIVLRVGQRMAGSGRAIISDRRYVVYTGPTIPKLEKLLKLMRTGSV
jgi:hypothetical protein